MTAPWQPLLDWWFGQAESPDEISADKGKLWFGKRDSQDLEARERFGVFVDLGAQVFPLYPPEILDFFGIRVQFDACRQPRCVHRAELILDDAIVRRGPIAVVGQDLGQIRQLRDAQLVSGPAPEGGW